LDRLIQHLTGRLSLADARHTRATLVIAIDGPSGSGKSSASRSVARRLGLRYLDTGAMYRAVTWWMLEHGADVEDLAAVEASADRPVLSLETDPESPRIAVDGIDVTRPIRERRVSNAVSAVSAVPAVRRHLVDLQRTLIGPGGIVVEGRDIGTVVAPSAPVKIFLTATSDARADRRTAELGHDPVASVDVTRAEMSRRDRLDSSRAASPLAKAADAYELDTTPYTLDEVVELILGIVKERTGVS
jgi:CMP/dCMP kinase